MQEKSLYQILVFAVFLAPLSSCRESAPPTSSLTSDFIPTFGAPTTEDEAMTKFGFPWPDGNPFPLRNFNGAECGVKKYRKKIDLACGIKGYIEERSPACGVEDYRQEESFDCPGSRKNSYETFTDLRTFQAGVVLGTGGWLSCPGGSFIENESDSKVVFKSTNEDQTLNLYEHRLTCFTPGIKNTCRLPIFGVELYKFCAHENHGTVFNECEHESFGVEEFNSCQIRSTVSELNNYLKYLEMQAPLWTEQVLLAQSKYFSKLESFQGMACLIRKNEFDPLVENVILELKTLFLNTYQVEYKGPIHCPDDYNLKEVIDAACSHRDQGYEICGAQMAYRLQKGVFRNHLEVLDELKEQPFFKNSTAISQQIQDSIKNLKDMQSK